MYITGGTTLIEMCFPACAIDFQTDFSQQDTIVYCHCHTVGGKPLQWYCTLISISLAAIHAGINKTLNLKYLERGTKASLLVVSPHAYNQ